MRSFPASMPRFAGHVAKRGCLRAAGSRSQVGKCLIVLRVSMVLDWQRQASAERPKMQPDQRTRRTGFGSSRMGMVVGYHRAKTSKVELQVREDRRDLCPDVAGNIPVPG